MKRATTAVVLVLAMVAAGAAAPDRDGKRWWSFVEMLANDDMQGRDTGSPAHHKAADLVAAEFERAGLTPAGVNGFLQPRSSPSMVSTSRISAMPFEWLRAR